VAVQLHPLPISTCRWRRRTMRAGESSAYSCHRVRVVSEVCCSNHRIFVRLSCKKIPDVRFACQRNQDSSEIEVSRSAPRVIGSCHTLNVEAPSRVTGTTIQSLCHPQFQHCRSCQPRVRVVAGPRGGKKYARFGLCLRFCAWFGRRIADTQMQSCCCGCCAPPRRLPSCISPN